MPLYNYRCHVCGNRFEEFFHSMNDPASECVECPACRVTGAKRLLSSGMRFTFKTGDFFEPYIDTDIHPDGQPIKVETQQQFFRECEKYGRGFKKVRDKLR